MVGSPTRTSMGLGSEKQKKKTPTKFGFDVAAFDLLLSWPHGYN